MDYTEPVKMTEDKERLEAQAELVKASSLTTEAMHVTLASARSPLSRAAPLPSSEKGARLAWKMSAGPCIAVRIIQLQKAAVRPTSGPTRRPSHLPIRVR